MITGAGKTREQLDREPYFVLDAGELESIINRGPVVVFLRRALEGWPVDFVSANVLQFGYQREDFLSHRVLFTDIIHPEDLERVTADVHRYSREGLTEFAQEYRILTATKDVRWVSERTWLRRGTDSAVNHYHGYIIDITDRKRTEAEQAAANEELAAVNEELMAAHEQLIATEEEIRQQYEELCESRHALSVAHQQLLDIIEFLPDPTFVIDAGKRVVAWNRAIEKMTGVPKEEILGKGDYAYAVPFYGRPRPILVDLLFAENSEIALQYGSVERDGNVLCAEVFVPSVYGGQGAFLWLSVSPLYDSEGKLVGAIETMRDVSDRKRMEARLKYLANHDPLTNVPNRYFLEENLKRVVAKTKRGDTSAALLCIDLDNFQLVNDALGHAAGDEVLVNLAKILQSNLREEDVLARLGGDEFGVLLEGVNARQAEVVAEKLRRAVEQRELCLVTHRTCFYLSVSVGVVMVDGSLEFQKLFSYADTAVSHAKERGRNRVAFVEPDEEITGRLSEAHQLVALVKRALSEDRFVLHYQPVVRIIDRKVSHYEALIRLRAEDGELILPGRFIPVAERFGLMSQIDRWVLQAVLKELNARPGLILFMNLSGVSLGDEKLLEFIVEAISQSGVHPSRLGFEITETAAVKGMMLAERWIGRLKTLGCSFALDDFGIGFSSFSYLQLLPVDFVKIDGSYVRNLDVNTTHRALVQAMNTVAHTLGKKTVAEFVENSAILDVLRELEVNAGQGYYLGRPVPVPEVVTDQH
ncbi:MAG: EAL domain-containing protein [Clostridia bacterium]|nr:EAL domain-containing protein [Clostridia bacterium]